MLHVTQMGVGDVQFSGKSVTKVYGSQLLFWKKRYEGIPYGSKLLALRGLLVAVKSQGKSVT